MRPGPHEVLLAQGTTVTARIDVVHGGRVIATNIPVKDVQVEVTEDRVVPEILTYTAPLSMVPVSPADPLNSFGQRSHLTVVQTISGRIFETAIGWFIHGSTSGKGWEEATGGVKITAYGLLQIPADNDFAFPSSPPADATLRSELSRLSGLPVMLDGLPDRAVPRTLQWGVKRLEALQDLAESYGLAYAVKLDGYLHVWDPSTSRAPAAHYAATLLEAPKEGMPRRANIFVGVGGSGSDETEKQWTYTARATDGPYSAESYGQITERIEVSAAESQAQVVAAVQARMQGLHVAQNTRSLGIIPDWRLEKGDVIEAEITTGSGVEYVTGRVTALSGTVRAGEQMRVDIEELEW